MYKSLILATVTAFTLTACDAYAAGHAPAAIQTMDAAGGTILTDAESMSLYTFDNDTAGKSNCNGGCAKKWPPLLAAADAAEAGEYGLIKRKDGTMQWAYNGEALYFWAGDKRAGDVKGDGVGGIWHLARP
ncbi:MAG: hypothetical protein V3V25_05335 [Paracoccaceae bacterium]